MRKLMLLAAMVGLVLVAVVPAIAQLSQGFSEEDVESGDVEPEIGIANKGDNVNLCAAVLQQAQSGNVQNEQGVVQYKSEVDEIEFEGSTITITPELVSECTQTIEQSAVAGGAPQPPTQPPDPQQPDLVLDVTCYFRQLDDEGQPFPSFLIVSVINQGAGPAGPFDTTLEFLPNPPFGFPGETRVLQPRVSVLDVGQSFTYLGPLSVPVPPFLAEPVPPGASPLSITVDSGGEVDESNEFNNTISFDCPSLEVDPPEPPQ